MRTLLIALLSVFAIIACDKDKTKKPDPEDMGAPVLNGEWTTSCISNSTPYSGPLGEKRFVKIEGTAVTASHLLFDDENCSDAKAQMTLTKRSRIGFTDLSTEGSVGFFNIDESINTYTIIPANPKYAEVLSNSEFCKVKRWQSGHEYNVTGCKSGTVQFLPLIRYSILKFDETADPDIFVLGHFTNSENGNTPQNRPKSLGGDLHFRIN